MTDLLAGHPSEEDLVLLHYGEHEDAPAVEAHLARCSGCRAARGALAADLAQVQMARGEPDAAFEGRLWARLRPQLDPARPAWRQPRRWAAGAALAASLVIAFLLGRHGPRPDPPPPPPAVADAADGRARILLAQVGEHLERSQIVLAETVNADPPGLEPLGERERAESLLAANRLYRQSAARSGEAVLTDVLDALEPILLEIVHASGSAEDLSDLRRRIDEQELLFKVRALRARVRGREGAGRADEGPVS